MPPATLIRRLTVATKRQGQGQGLGLGRALIADAIIRTESSSIGAYALIVDAKDEHAGAFYAANGFAPIPDEARRMFLPMATTLQILESERRG
ncbi:MAG: GNAT family N-acetyltransferase [Methylocystis sp.]